MFKKILGLSLGVGMLLNSTTFAASEQHSWVDDIARSNEVYNAYVCENCGEMRYEEIAKIRNYIISLDANGGIAEPSQLTTKNGKVKLSIPANSSDYLFEGWYDENGTLVTSDRVFKEDTTLYARWSTDSTYTLYFASDGSSRIKPITGAYGMTVLLAGYIPVKEGYVFEGWYRRSAG